MSNWLSDLQQLIKEEQKAVIILVASVKGSTPREAGTRMLVSRHNVKHTIGGGHLEFKAIQAARNMLDHEVETDVQNFSLGASLGQCCGGAVTLFFEVVTADMNWPQQLQDQYKSHQPAIQIIPLDQNSNAQRLLVSDHSVQVLDGNRSGSDVFVDESLVNQAAALLTQHGSGQAMIKSFEDDCGIPISYVFDPIIQQDFRLFLFGAGHVGQALVKLLAEQPCQVSWIDSRDDQLPNRTAENIMVINTDVPEAVIDDAPPDSYFLVMTHDHKLDQHLVEHILQRNDFNYLGLIGSATKRKRFEHRLLERGFSAETLSGMTCPIGIKGIHSKRPAAIALSVMAELLQVFEAKTNAIKDNKNGQQKMVLQR